MRPHLKEGRGEKEGGKGGREGYMEEDERKKQLRGRKVRHSQARV